jgi:hypothetical protein
VKPTCIAKTENLHIGVDRDRSAMSGKESERVRLCIAYFLGSRAASLRSRIGVDGWAAFYATRGRPSPRRRQAQIAVGFRAAHGTASKSMGDLGICFPFMRGDYTSGNPGITTGL